MSQPFLGQIQPLAFGFAPIGWAQCNGQLLSIAQNTALFALIGTFYGGNGQTTFALPNLQSRVPVHMGTNAGESYVIGEEGGAEQVTLNSATMATHSHAFSGTTDAGNEASPTAGAALAKIGGAGNSYYASDTTPQSLSLSSVGMVGGNQPHDNIQPYLTINWCIALTGIFPSRN